VVPEDRIGRRLRRETPGPVQIASVLSGGLVSSAATSGRVYALPVWASFSLFSICFNRKSRCAVAERRCLSEGAFGRKRRDRAPARFPTERIDGNSDWSRRNLALSGALRMRKMATIATLILLTGEYFCIRRLNGGERRIRTLETLQDSGGGVQRGLMFASEEKAWRCLNGQDATTTWWLAAYFIDAIRACAWTTRGSSFASVSNLSNNKACSLCILMLICYIAYHANFGTVHC
jgi:hypothetical protein